MKIFLDGTGFSRINLSSVYDLTVYSGVSLAPSGTKLLYQSYYGRFTEVERDLDFLGDTGVTLAAGSSIIDELSSEIPNDFNTIRYENAALITGENTRIHRGTGGEPLNFRGRLWTCQVFLPPGPVPSAFQQTTGFCRFRLIPMRVLMPGDIIWIPVKLLTTVKSSMMSWTVEP